MWVPRTIVRPSGRFSFVSVVRPSVEPGAEDLVFFLFTIRNSSVSARTRFMCYTGISVLSREPPHWFLRTLSNASISPTISLESAMMTRIRLPI